MATLSSAYSGIADVNLWFKNRTGDKLMLADIPSIIPLRWAYFRDSWDFIKINLINDLKSSSNPDFLNKQIDDFSKFIDAQRTSSPKINPLSGTDQFYRFYSIFDNISIHSIGLTNEEKRLMSDEIARVRAFSKNNFLMARKNITDYRDRMTDIYGLTDPDYNLAFGRRALPAQVSGDIVDLNYLNTLDASIKSINFILANLFAVDSALDPFALARANANNPDVNIGQYKSGRLVKLNYGESLESLASRFFGDPNKWIDIAIANGLKPPYIDEVGVRVSLIANGSSNQINLSETDANGQLNIDKIYINQPLFIQSSTEVVPTQRIITNIRQIPVSGEIIIELDGVPDLGKYRIADAAYIRVFAPGTINSSFFILIPSQEVLVDNRDDEVPWFLAKSAADEKRAQIDLAINENGEITFTPNGDIRLSYGIENAIQAIKLKIITELGTLKFHPTFGLVNVVGTKNSNIDEIKELLTQSIVSQIEIDPRFERVENLVVDYLVNDKTNQGVAAISISMSVRMAGSEKVIPISFRVNNS